MTNYNRYCAALGVGGYYRFAYIDGRRYDIRGLSKKFASVLYFLQRMGLVTLTADKTIAATLPTGILPPKATTEVWLKDLNNVIDAFGKTLGTEDKPDKKLDIGDVQHVVNGSPVQDATVIEALANLVATVKTINTLRMEENAVRQAADILGRDISTIKDDRQLRQRFVFELSAPALKAAALRVRKDYPTKPEKWAKMKKQDREASGWNEYGEIWINKAVVAAQDGTLVDNPQLLNNLAYTLTAESAHAAWRIEAARRHPDQGGSAESSAAFGAVWDRAEKLFEAAKATAAGK
jgi:hypothetical protein